MFTLETWCAANLSTFCTAAGSLSWTCFISQTHAISLLITFDTEFPIGFCFVFTQRYIYPGRQCWSLPATRTMLMFGLVKHRHSQCWCLTPVKKSTDLGSTMKCKIIIHVFIMPISKRVGALGTEFETYKILQVLNFRTGNKSRNPICKYTVRVHGQNMGP